MNSVDFCLHYCKRKGKMSAKIYLKEINLYKLNWSVLSVWQNVKLTVWYGLSYLVMVFLCLNCVYSAFVTYIFPTLLPLLVNKAAVCIRRPLLTVYCSPSSFKFLHTNSGTCVVCTCQAQRRMHITNLNFSTQWIEAGQIDYGGGVQRGRRCFVCNAPRRRRRKYIVASAGPVRARSRWSQTRAPRMGSGSRHRLYMKAVRNVKAGQCKIVNLSSSLIYDGSRCSTWSCLQAPPL